MNTPVIENTVNTIKKIADDLSGSLPVKHIQSFLGNLNTAGRMEWPSLKIGDLHIRKPVVQGGMGVGLSLSGLAAAVANAGGVGVIAANAIGMLEKDYFKDGRAANLSALRREIRTARSNSDGVIGVNIMVAVNDFHELLDVAIEEKVDIVFMGAGLPIKNLPVEKLRNAGVKAVPIVSSARAVEMIFKMWKKIYNDVPDAVVLEGPLAGGHIGFSAEQIDQPEFQLEHLLPLIVEAVKPFEADFGRAIPVIAGGGVYSGEDIHKMIKLGASGVQMGTRFIATDECDADRAFKEAYVACSKEDIGLIKSPVGMPGRAIRNSFIKDSEAGRRPSFKCAWQCLASCKAEAANYCISIALNNARRGKLEQGFVFAGANAYRITEIVPVASLVAELEAEYSKAAGAVISQRLSGIVESLKDLRAQYDALKARAGEAGKAYENALKERIRNIQDSGMEEITRQYTAILESMKEIQFRLTEKLADSCALLNSGSIPASI